ncbi:MAG: hypothetical protein JW940_30035 [Polyangiaceae bacterium]|nr:hypothetical protein [Polyangiaceae bacterium]
MSQSHRVRVLCEDRRTERFLRRLCERLNVRVEEILVAPSGAGDASRWVIAQYRDRVRQLRSKRFQSNLGLLAQVDGDKFGVVDRKRQLDKSLADASLQRRQNDEPIAIFVPTWCIETWILHLTGIAEPPESAQVKRDPTYQDALHELDADERGHLMKAVAGWPAAPGGAALLPSLQDACTEGRRVGIV